MGTNAGSCWMIIAFLCNHEHIYAMMNIIDSNGSKPNGMTVFFSVFVVVAAALLKWIIIILMYYIISQCEKCEWVLIVHTFFSSSLKSIKW